MIVTVTSYTISYFIISSLSFILTKNLTGNDITDLFSLLQKNKRDSLNFCYYFELTLFSRKHKVANLISLKLKSAFVCLTKFRTISPLHN